jgi:hypothetical protein
MGAITTLKQNNKPWTLTWKASGRYPIVADRIFATLADAQAYVDDKSATASATSGLVLSVINDSIAKNNGVYYVKSVANTDPKYGAILDKGTLVKVGGSETETADNYSAAVELSKTLVMGQLIKVSGEETIDSQTYKAGFYIVNAPGSISALDTSTGASDEIGALINRVAILEGNRVTNTEFAEYKASVDGQLGGKADSTTVATHIADTVAHVTAEDKVKWNNAETNAKAFTTEELGKLSTVYDAYGAAAEARTAAEGYAKAAIETAVGVYASEGVEASGLRKEIIAAQAAAEATAKSYADTITAQAANDAKAQIDALAGIVGVEASEGVEATGIFKTISGIDTRVATLEAIDHEKIATEAASEAAAAAVAGVIDGAPEKFDTLKEIAAWIADADTADDAASLVTRVAALEAIDHNAYVEADTALEGRVEVYANGVAANALKDAKAYTDTEIGKLDTAAQGYANAAKDDAIAAAQAHVTEVLESYYTKSEVDTKVSKDIDSAKEAVIAQAQADIAKAIEDLGIGNYATIAYVDGEIASTKTYAENYTNELFASVKFADENDIDTEIFGKVTE